MEEQKDRIAALDIGGTKMKACLFTRGEASPILEADTRAKALGAAGVLENSAGLLSRLGEFDRLGVSTAGQVDWETGIIRYANDNLPGYTGTDVRGFFTRRFEVPVAVENDVNAAALGEWKLGAARGENHCLCLTYGTGVGGAAILNGALYRGQGGSAGEFGAVVLHPEACVKTDPYSGCYERCASTTALMGYAREVEPGLKNGKELFARREEPLLAKAIDRWLEEVAHGLCTLIHCFNPGCVLLGGGVMEQPFAVAGAREKTMARLIPSFQQVKICGTALGNGAGLYGAAWLAGQL